MEGFADPMQAVQAISSAPRAPSPSATRMAPSGPVAPNFMRGAALRPGIEVDMAPTGSIPAAEDAGRNDPPGHDLQNVLRDAERAQAFTRGSGAVPELAARATRLAPACKEETESVFAEWRPMLETVLERLGAPSPQARLGCAFNSAGEASHRLCASPGSAPTPNGPPE